MSVEPSLTSELVVGGRKKHSNEVDEWLRSTSTSISVQAPTKDEAIAFIAAIINNMPEDRRETYLSRTLIIEDLKSFRQIAVTCNNNLLLIPDFEDIDKVFHAQHQGHRIL